MCDASDATPQSAPFECDLSDRYVMWMQLPFRIPEGWEVAKILDKETKETYWDPEHGVEQTSWVLVELHPDLKNRGGSRACDPQVEDEGLKDEGPELDPRSFPNTGISSPLPGPYGWQVNCDCFRLLGGTE